VKKRFSGVFSGYLVGRRDDSTFLSDGFFGNSLLLPNRNLDTGLPWKPGEYWMADEALKKLNEKLATASP